MRRTQRVMLAIGGAAVTGVALVMLAMAPGSARRGAPSTQATGPATVAAPTAVAAAASSGERATPAATGPAPAVAALRAEFLATDDLQALQARLLASDAPGARVYASLAQIECASRRLTFGDGAEAWAKLNRMVDDAAPDRGQRVAPFQHMQQRCRGFGHSGAPLAAAGAALGSAAALLQEHDLVTRSHALLELAAKTGSADAAALDEAAATALASGDPELLSALANRWSLTIPDGAGPLRVDEAAIASTIARSIAVEAVSGRLPLAALWQQQATCLIGRGCDAVTARDVYERSLWDRPPDRVRLILATADALAPEVERALRSGRPPAPAGGEPSHSR